MGLVAPASAVQSCAGLSALVPSGSLSPGSSGTQLGSQPSSAGRTVSPSSAPSSSSGGGFVKGIEEFQRAFDGSAARYIPMTETGLFILAGCPPKVLGEGLHQGHLDAIG